MFYLTTSCPSAPFVLLFNSRVLALTLYLIPSGRLPCGVFLKKELFFLIYWCLVSCSCVLSLLFRVPCVGGVGGGREGWGKNLSIFYTDMDYLYCMPKWSHSRFYEIKLLRNISIYWYIKFIKTVPRYVLTLSGFYAFWLKSLHICSILNKQSTPSVGAADMLFCGFSQLNVSDWRQLLTFLLIWSFDAPVTLMLPLKGAESSGWLPRVPMLADKTTTLNVISKDHGTMLYCVKWFHINHPPHVCVPTFTLQVCFCPCRK